MVSQTSEEIGSTLHHRLGLKRGVPCPVYLLCLVIDPFDDPLFRRLVFSLIFIFDSATSSLRATPFDGPDRSGDEYPADGSYSFKDPAVPAIPPCFAASRSLRAPVLSASSPRRLGPHRDYIPRGSTMHGAIPPPDPTSPRDYVDHVEPNLLCLSYHRCVPRRPSHR